MARARAVVGVIVSLVVAVLATPVTPAAAATPTAFNDASPLVFLSQSDNATQTTLYEAAQTSGKLNFNDVVTDNNQTLPYNAIGFNTTDMFLYGLKSVAGAAAANPELYKIGQNGVSQDLGSVSGVGTFAGGALNAGDMGQTVGTDTTWKDVYFFRSNATANLQTIYYIPNVSTSRVAKSAALSMSVPNTADIVFLNGFIWAFYGNSTTTGTGGAGFYRITPSSTATTWQVSYFPHTPASLGLIADNYGAQWAYGNGNLGVATNANGTGVGTTPNTTAEAYQIQITNPSGTNPSFNVVAKMGTTPSAGNDAASYIGTSVDLSIRKDATPVYTPGGQISYKLTVTNNDTKYASSGFVVNDTIPSTITGLSANDAGATFSGNVMTWVGDALGPGASVTLTVTGTVVAATSGIILNSATVTGNEDDPNLANNTDSAISVPAANLSKNAIINGAASASNGTSSVPATVQIGDTIMYQVSVYNWPNGSVGDIVTDKVPSGLTVAGPISNGGTLDPSTNTITWNLSGVGTGVVQLSFTATVATSGEFDNNAQVTYYNGNTGTTNTTYHKATSSNLTVTKTITGRFSDMTKQFPFSVTFKDGSGNLLTGTIPSSEGNLPLVGGAASFSLGNGDKIVFTVPIGDSVQISETDNKGYDTTFVDSGNSGVTGTGPATAALAISGNREIDFTNEAIYAPPMGVQMDTGGVLGLGAIAILLAGAAYVLRFVAIGKRTKEVN